ncbi:MULTISPECIES: hypothetical protein [Nostoc]|uniref:hypothetical protein n=1 Tax=Nostoc TaxID=1177 RepID=UPI0025AAC042|nr:MULTISPECIES: hypothetical protein [unclassified Nostoc]MBN3907499.1 hypothetical protein [Nostoc sp. NMS1]MDM9580237.1 hypothetical protein [Nostoc sp. GT001]
MERNQAQTIVVSLTGTLAAISIGYIGVQIFGRYTMYTIATVMLGLGTGGAIGQILVEKRQQRIVQPQSKQR